MARVVNGAIGGAIVERIGNRHDLEYDFLSWNFERQDVPYQCVYQTGRTRQRANAKSNTTNPP